MVDERADRAKASLGEWAASRIRGDLRLGIGSGSTVDAFIGALGRREEAVKRSLCCAAASLESERQAREAGLIIKPLEDFSELDLVVDGADAVGPEGTLIKGGGAALVRERLLIAAAKRVQILLDATKPVGPLSNLVVPLAVVPFGWRLVKAAVAPQVDWVKLRTRAGKPQVTDDGLYVLDVHYGALDDPQSWHQNLKQLPGVVDTGIFFGYAPEIWMSDGESVWRAQ